MKIKNIVTGIVCVGALSACNMDYHEYNNYNKEYLSQSYDEVIGLVTNIYTKIDYDFGQDYDGGMFASACDEADYAYSDNDICDFTNGSWSPSNPLSRIWTTSYQAIQMCNQYIENFQGLTFDDLELNDEYRSHMFRYRNSFNEARLLRAYFYFNLARAYGDVPYFTHMVTTDEVNSLTRTPVQEVFDSIIAVCDEMYKQLPADYTNLGLDGIAPAENGRVTRYVALALKARAALYAASPLFNKNNDPALWRRAAEANKAVIDTCAQYGFTLGKYSELWGANNFSNKEMIFVRRKEGNNALSNNLETFNFPIGVPGGNSGNCPTQNLVDAYEMQATGMAWNEPGSGYDESKPYEGRDPRFYLTIVKNGDTGWPSKNANAIETFYGGLNAEPISGATTTGYYLKKYLDSSIDLSASSSTKTSRHSWITFRLGEFYLNYAEAVFRYTGAADAPGDWNMTAREAVNVIRNRSDVKMPEFPAGLSADEFWKKYENERMVELAFEGHRFWDLRRWKEGEKLGSIIQMKLTKNSDGSITYRRQTVNRTWDDKMYLFPIPQTERMKNPNLEQNPGW